MVLVTLVLTNLMIRNLANAAGGTINPKDVVVLMGLGIINYLAILLAVSIFIATLIVLNRWYKDSELVVWQTAGISLFQVLKAIFAFTLPLTVVIAILSIVVSPLANEQANIIKQRFQQREDTSLLAPGQFKESTSNDRVFFIEEIDFEKNNLKNIFVSIFGKEKQIIISAKEGFIENDVNGDRYLTLRPGRRYEGIAGELEFRITEFDSYVAKLNPKKTIETTPTNRTLQIWELIQNWTPLNQSELLWRKAESSAPPGNVQRSEQYQLHRFDAEYLQQRRSDSVTDSNVEHVAAHRERGSYVAAWIEAGVLAPVPDSIQDKAGSLPGASLKFFRKAVEPPAGSRFYCDRPTVPFRQVSFQGALWLFRVPQQRGGQSLTSQQSTAHRI